MGLGGAIEQQPQFGEQVAVTAVGEITEILDQLSERIHRSSIDGRHHFVNASALDQGQRRCGPSLSLIFGSVNPAPLWLGQTLTHISCFIGVNKNPGLSMNQPKVVLGWFIRYGKR